ncbi:MAG: antitoxin VapB family protein [Candidatus Helarchaeota archaeon]
MTQKTISLPEDVYKKLKAEKKKNESFPQLILRLLKTREVGGTIEQLAGVFKEESEEWENIEKIIYMDRLRTSKREIKLNDE